MAEPIGGQRSGGGQFVISQFTAFELDRQALAQLRQPDIDEWIDRDFAIGNVCQAG